MPSLAEDFLGGIHPGWARLLTNTPGLLAAAFDALVVVEASIARGDQVVPPPHLILEALRYFDPRDTKVVIIAQDPYHTVQDGVGAQAQGLCFSCNPAVAQTQPSLNVIRGAVSADTGGAAVHRLHDLRFWAAQGVLMLNRALTTLRGLAKAHQRAWMPFTKLLIEALCDHVRPTTVSPPARLHALGGRGAEAGQHCEAVRPRRSRVEPPVTSPEQHPA